MYMHIHINAHTPPSPTCKNNNSNAKEGAGTQDYPTPMYTHPPLLYTLSMKGVDQDLFLKPKDCPKRGGMASPMPYNPGASAGRPGHMTI